MCIDAETKSPYACHSGKQGSPCSAFETATTHREDGVANTRLAMSGEDVGDQPAPGPLAIWNMGKYTDIRITPTDAPMTMTMIGSIMPVRRVTKTSTLER